jgi:Dyp-type peroxidase family
LKIDDSKLGDEAFLKGQRADAESLADKGTGTGDTFIPDWEEAFQKPVDGAIILAGDSHGTVDKKLDQIEAIFGVGTQTASISTVTSIRGDSRPGDLSAHEHFGYLDGVSNPAIIDFDTNPPPGPAPIHAGVIVLGHDGDLKKNTRDPWMVDGSFLVFRHLFQKVPEFDAFVQERAKKLVRPGITEQQAADLLGARLVGRWKSGAPLDLTPFEDDADLGPDPDRNNNFHFTAERDFQKLCPFAAHIRKTLPRADLEANNISIENKRIIRRGIQFGPEVTKTEKKAKRTMHGRGLLFACYQSSIMDGFRFIQTSWCNNPNFPPFERAPEVPGFDPLIGQGTDRKMSGFDPNDPTQELSLADLWVVPRGGEYFFSPSIKALTHTIAT